MKAKKIFKGILFKVSLIILFGTILICYSSTVNTSIIVSALSQITEPVQSFFSSKYNIVAIDKDDIDQNELTELREKTVDYYELKQENEQLKKILGIKQQHQDYKLVQADVIGRDPCELFYSATLNCGLDCGVTINSPVITDKAVVGYISAVYSTYSKVNTLLSPQTNIAAYDTQSNDSGVVCGDTENIENQQLTFKYINNQNNIQKGDMIVSSGVGKVYPKNLLIGQVSNILDSENGYDISANIKPYEDIKNIRKVYVIVDFLGKGHKS